MFLSIQNYPLMRGNGGEDIRMDMGRSCFRMEGEGLTWEKVLHIDKPLQTKETTI